MRHTKRFFTTVIAMVLMVALCVEQSLLLSIHANASETGGAYEKEETVYVIADSKGKAQETIVSNWLKNTSKADTLVDDAALTNIENVKGDEKFTERSDGISFAAGGKDIYYNGTTKKETPVGVKLTYFLDGSECNAEDIVGKSGEVTIRMEYISNQEKDPTPFVMVSGMICSNDTFQNIEVKNGRVVSDGDKSVVVGYGIAGLKDCVDLSQYDLTKDLEIPDYVEIKAKVQDFEMPMTMTVAMNDFLSDIEMDSEALDDLYDKVNDLSDATEKLVDGSSKVSEGISTLKDKLKAFAMGVDKLADNSDALVSGSKKLSDSLATLNKKVKPLAKGAAELKKGSADLYAGIKTAYTGADAVKTGAEGVKGGVDTLKTALAEINSNVQAFGAKGGDLVTGIQTVSTNVGLLKKGADDFTTGLGTASETYAKLSLTVAGDEQLVAALKQANASNSDPVAKATMDVLLAKLETNTANQKAIATGLTTASSTMITNMKTLATNLGKLQAGIDEKDKGLLAQAKVAAAGLTTLATAMTKVTEGSATLYDGADKLATGASSLYEGMGKLKTGGKTLKDGMKKANSGVNTLTKASKELKRGSGKLTTAVTKYTEGVGSVQKATKKLVSGVDKLKTGSKELYDGIVKFKKEGIDNIVELVNGDVKGLQMKFEDVLYDCKDYTSFAGIGEKGTGSVKFLIKTEEVNGEQK